MKTLTLLLSLYFVATAMASDGDPFEIIGVPPNCTNEVLMEAYGARVQQNLTDPQKLQRLAKALDQITDPNKRRQLDEAREHRNASEAREQALADWLAAVWPSFENLPEHLRPGLLAVEVQSLMKRLAPTHMGEWRWMEGETRQFGMFADHHFDPIAKLYSRLLKERKISNPDQMILAMKQLVRLSNLYPEPSNLCPLIAWMLNEWQKAYGADSAMKIFRHFRGLTVQDDLKTSFMLFLREDPNFAPEVSAIIKSMVVAK